VAVGVTGEQGVRSLSSPPIPLLSLEVGP